MSTPCPNCGHTPGKYRNPVPTVDIIIHHNGKIVLIERKNVPRGWALPGGYIDYGESAEEAAVREAMEETGLELDALRQFRVYSDPKRDPRQHNLSIVFTAEGRGSPVAGDDASGTKLFYPEELPSPLCFDHEQIIADYLSARAD